MGTARDGGPGVAEHVSAHAVCGLPISCCGSLQKKCAGGWAVCTSQVELRMQQSLCCTAIGWKPIM